MPLFVYIRACTLHNHSEVHKKGKYINKLGNFLRMEILVKNL